MILVPTLVRPSPIHGLGLFAQGPIAMGTPFWRFEPGFDQKFSRESANLFLPHIRRHLEWFAWFSGSDSAWILSGDHACFMNHSSEPNTGLPTGAREPFTTVALRDIKDGEELTCDYLAFDAEARAKLQ